MRDLPHLLALDQQRQLCLRQQLAAVRLPEKAQLDLTAKRARVGVDRHIHTPLSHLLMRKGQRIDIRVCLGGPTLTMLDLILRFWAECGKLWRKGGGGLLEEVQILHQSERGRVALVLDRQTNTKYIRRELSGEWPIYRQLGGLPHPYLPKIEGVTQEDGKTVVLEEYIEGAALDGLSLSQRQLTRLLLELRDVLEFLHGHGILHRDIKPSNLMLAADGHLRLIDFDAAREEKPEAEQDTRLLGTRGYAPPEQYGFAQTDARTDIYALGITFRQLLGPLARRRRWKKLLRKCTALDPKDRYRSVGQVRRAVYWGRVRRWLIRPALILAGLGLALYLAAWVYMYNTSEDLRWVLDNVWLIDRPHIFRTIDIDAVKDAEPTGGRYCFFDVSPWAEKLQKAYPQCGIIYTCYIDNEQGLLFGMFDVEYDLYSGRLRQDKFLGLCAVSETCQFTWITPEECVGQANRYGRAVLALYDLDTFDTPLF